MSATTSKTDFAKALVHTVTLPSGSEVKIRIPNLPTLLKEGKIPNPLLKYAIPELRATTEESPDQKPTEEEIIQIYKDSADFQAFIVSETLAKPAVAADEVHATVSVPDIEMLVELGLRQRDMDAVGHHIGGLEAVAAFRTFRGLPTGDEDLLDL